MWMWLNIRNTKQHPEQMPHPPHALLPRWQSISLCYSFFYLLRNISLICLPFSHVQWSPWIQTRRQGGDKPNASLCEKGKDSERKGEKIRSKPVRNKELHCSLCIAKLPTPRSRHWRLRQTLWCQPLTLSSSHLLLLLLSFRAHQMFSYLWHWLPPSPTGCRWRWRPHRYKCPPRCRRQAL